MKKLTAFLLLSCLGGLATAQTFTANTSLVFEPTAEQRQSFYDKFPPPRLVVYQKSGATLVLLAAVHSPESIPFVHYAFD
ncbi:MAG: hypothetical protein J6S61_03610, partial [Elusimicrobiaceae bacterium]|nr:hypothetical protein [Elusimicrobiaceae bacterium]